MRFGRLAVAGVIMGLAAGAQAQAVDGGSTQDVPQASLDGGESPAAGGLMDEIDAAAGAPVKTASPNAAPQPSPIARAFQSMNPDVSVIIDGTGGYMVHAPYSLAGDDPALGGSAKTHAMGFTVQEAEVGFQSVVDPYFRADMFLTIPNLDGLEVEEGYVTTTALPADLQMKAGIFRSAFGRQNGQHLHLQDFTRRPLINAAYLGEDGLRAPGAQLSWLAPTPFYLALIGEVFTVGAPDDANAITSFGGGDRTDLTYAVEAKIFVPATESVSIYGGLNAAFGRASLGPQLLDTAQLANQADATSDAASQLYAADLYVKMKPPNVSGGYTSVAWQSEFFLRRVSDQACLRLDGICTETIRRPQSTDGGFYTQLVMQVARSWIVGVREDLLGVPTSDLQQRVNRVSLSATFVTSEFARVRADVEREDVTTAGPVTSTTDANYGAFLQLEIAMGAHGAHPF